MAWELDALTPSSAEPQRLTTVRSQLIEDRFIESRPVFGPPGAGCANFAKSVTLRMVVGGQLPAQDARCLLPLAAHPGSPGKVFGFLWCAVVGGALPTFTFQKHWWLGVGNYLPAYCALHMALAAAAPRTINLYLRCPPWAHKQRLAALLADVGNERMHLALISTLGVIRMDAPEAPEFDQGFRRRAA